MKQRTIGRIVGVVVILWVVLLTAAGGPAARARVVPAPSPHCGGWSIVPSPNPTDYRNELNAVAAVSATDVWAVGWDSLGGTLIEHWNGTDWQVGASPEVDGVFFGIAALSASNVWAVGDSSTGPLIEHWDGTVWQSVSSPAVAGGGFTGISAQSASDIWAVGGQAGDKTLTEHWDGTSWQVVASPNVSGTNSLLNSVSAVSATDVWAVGDDAIYRGPSNTLIEHWDGQHWRIVPSPNGSTGKHRFNILWSVAAVSAQNIWAVGRVLDSTLNEHWDGSTWSVVSPGLNGIANGVVAITATNIWAVGFALVNYSFDTFVEQWNGTRWQPVLSPNVTATTISATNENYLNGVSASSAHNIWAVGYYATYSSNTTYTLIESYC
ncbi:MAG: beta propeller repeat protein [Ktedonobacteraceae bacterium]